VAIIYVKYALLPICKAKSWVVQIV